jgi:hypothetical protein
MERDLVERVRQNQMYKTKDRRSGKPERERGERKVDVMVL